MICFWKAQTLSSFSRKLTEMLLSIIPFYKRHNYLSLSLQRNIVVTNNHFLSKGAKNLSLSNQPNRVVTMDHSLLKQKKNVCSSLSWRQNGVVIIEAISKKTIFFLPLTQPKVVINDSLSKGTKIIVPLPVIINDLLLKGTHFSLPSR